MSLRPKQLSAHIRAFLGIDEDSIQGWGLDEPRTPSQFPRRDAPVRRKQEAWWLKAALWLLVLPLFVVTIAACVIVVLPLCGVIQALAWLYPRSWRDL